MFCWHSRGIVAKGEGRPVNTGPSSAPVTWVQRVPTPHPSLSLSLLFGTTCGQYVSRISRYTTWKSFKNRTNYDDVSLVDFTYLVFTLMPGERYRRRLTQAFVVFQCVTYFER